MGDTSGVIAVVIFPQCWDGQLVAGNDTAHLAYPVSPGVCPAGFPIALPRLEEHLHLGVVDPIAPDGTIWITLSSGPYYTLHGDFMNAWVPSSLAGLTLRCIDAHVECLKANGTAGQ
jgi:Domain of unknown function (DUF1996)